MQLLGYVPGSVAVKEKLKFDTNSLAEYLKEAINMNTDGNIYQIALVFFK